MGDTTFYHIYSSGDESGPKKVEKINLLVDLASKEVVPAIPEAKTHKKAGHASMKLAKTLAIIGSLILLIYFIPSLLSLANFKLSGNEVNSLTAAKAAATGRSLSGIDPTLPKTNHLIIPSIGVNTDIEEATYDNYEEALKKGVWRVSNFGEPDQTGAPVILAAHRYGYLAWTNTFRHTSSFYNLPKVKEGDVIAIDWQQRKYTYGVYKVETGEAITDYSADVILYTCESLSGSERIFVYARLLQ